MAVPVALFIVVVLCAPFLSCAQRDAETLAEIEALTSFKLNLHDPLGALNGWDTSTASAPCDWRGVGCDNNRVTELRLPRLQLGGRLSDRLADLRMLRKLSLRSNFFNGTVPHSLSKCTLLRAVFLQYNSLSGTLLPEIGNLTGLQILNLAQNRLSGEISGELPQSLKYLDLSSNAFSGEIPSVANLTQLQLINLSYNQFSGQIPASFGELQELQYLWLDHNLLEGTVPSAIANCSSLVHLSAEGNSLGGVVPAALGALPKLQVLSLSQNNLSGSVPASMLCNISAYTPSLRIVQLGFNGFKDIVNPEIATCFSVLQVLDLQHNQIHGVFPSLLTRITTLSMVDLSNNLFSGVIPAEIGNLSRLEELNVANNSFSGAIPIEIKQCSSLRRLDFEGNHFAGTIPDFLGDMKGLQLLSLGGNSFTGSIPVSFGDFSILETLSLRANRLNGSLPEELMGLSNLTTLELSGNDFSGEIPTSIGNLSKLMVLNLSGNGFSGKVPASLGNLFRLTSLDLSKQSLVGELPFELSGLPNLQVIALQENSLSGDVPEGFSSLMGLRYLNLSSNAFSGHIPVNYGFLRSLEVLSLSNNSLSFSHEFSFSLHLLCFTLAEKRERERELKKQVPSNRFEHHPCRLGIPENLFRVVALNFFCCCWWCLKMIVANSFDLWQKDTFFSAAEEVQESADAMESAYRTWVRERRETLSPEDLDELCRELQTALGTAKWQLEEFVRAVRLSYGHRGNDNTTIRHREFIDAIENQISRVETALRESFNEEGKQPLQWVNLDEDERDELATFLSGTSRSLQSSKDECLELKPSMKSSLLENHAQRKDADLKYSAACDRNFSDEMEGFKDVCVKKDGNHVIKIESNEIHGRMDDIICQADRITNNTRRTWSSPNFSELKIIIPDEDEHINKLMLSVEDTPKEKGLKPVFRKQRHGEFLRIQGAFNLFNQLFGRVGGFQRQLQSPLHLPLRCSVQVTLALMLTIFLIVPFVFYSA